jgi:D-sedoheptulose 7-phosphate isomerase
MLPLLEEVSTAFGLIRPETVEKIALAIIRQMKTGSIFICGNGGSAATSLHLELELSKEAQREAGCKVSSLTANSALLTALGNDIGFSECLSRQIEYYGRPGDLLWSFTVSGESENIINAIRAAKARKMVVIALTGAPPNSACRLADHHLAIMSAAPGVVETCHVAIMHALTLRLRRRST